MNVNHKPTIGSLTKEIMGLVWILIKICVSYIEDFTREILNLAISHDTNTPLSEGEERRERAVHVADGNHDGDWQRDMEQDWNVFDDVVYRYDNGLYMCDKREVIMNYGVIKC
jgi:hypothetical protein